MEVAHEQITKQLLQLSTQVAHVRQVLHSSQLHVIIKAVMESDLYAQVVHATQVVFIRITLILILIQEQELL